MFTADSIQTRVQRRPFVPLRVVTSSGQAFDVSRPELVMVGQRERMIGTGSARKPTHYELVSRVAIMHVTALEHLAPRAPAGGDGEQ